VTTAVSGGIHKAVGARRVPTMATCTLWRRRGIGLSVVLANTNSCRITVTSGRGGQCSRFDGGA
jgi:hypothetical protein